MVSSLYLGITQEWATMAPYNLWASTSRIPEPAKSTGRKGAIDAHTWDKVFFVTEEWVKWYLNLHGLKTEIGDFFVWRELCKGCIFQIMTLH